MSDERKLAGIVDITAGTIMAFVFGGVFTQSNDPELLEAIPDLHTIGVVGAAIGAVIVILGILILRRVAVAAMLSMGIYAIVAAFAVYATASGYLGAGRKDAGYVLIVMSIAGAAVQYRAWKELR